MPSTPTTGPVSEAAHESAPVSPATLTRNYNPEQRLRAKISASCARLSQQKARTTLRRGYEFGEWRGMSQRDMLLYNVLCLHDDDAAHLLLEWLGQKPLLRDSAIATEKVGVHGLDQCLDKAGDREDQASGAIVSDRNIKDDIPANVGDLLAAGGSQDVDQGVKLWISKEVAFAAEEASRKVLSPSPMSAFAEDDECQVPDQEALAAKLIAESS